MCRQGLKIVESKPDEREHGDIHPYVGHVEQVVLGASYDVSSQVETL